MMGREEGRVCPPPPSGEGLLKVCSPPSNNSCLLVCHGGEEMWLPSVCLYRTDHPGASPGPSNRTLSNPA